MNYKIITLLFSIQLSVFCHAEPPLASDGKNILKNTVLANWSVLIQRSDKKIRRIHFNLKTNQVNSEWGKPSLKQFKTAYQNNAVFGQLGNCYAANYQAKKILCSTGVIHAKTKATLNKGGSDALIDIDTFNIINKDIKITGPFSLDGRYIISGRGIYDVKNKKIVTAVDKNNQPTPILVVLPNMEKNTGLNFTYPTIPTSDGNFIAGLTDENEEDRGLVQLNLYDIIKNKGFARKVKLIKLDHSSPLPTVGEYNYIGKNTYLLKESNRKSIAAEIKGWVLKDIYACNVSPDHALSICWTKPINGNPLRTMYLVNIKKRQVAKTYEKVHPGKVFWLWKGKAKDFTGYQL